MYCEISQPLTETFGGLDPRIDARLADLEVEGNGENDWSGFQKIEKILWEKNTISGIEKTADELIVVLKIFVQKFLY